MLYVNGFDVWGYGLEGEKNFGSGGFCGGWCDMFIFLGVGLIVWGWGFFIVCFIGGSWDEILFEECLNGCRLIFFVVFCFLLFVVNIIGKVFFEIMFCFFNLVIVCDMIDFMGMVVDKFLFCIGGKVLEIGLSGLIFDFLVIVWVGVIGVEIVVEFFDKVGLVIGVEYIVFIVIGFLEVVFGLKVNFDIVLCVVMVEWGFFEVFKKSFFDCNNGEVFGLCIDFWESFLMILFFVLILIVCFCLRRVIVVVCFLCFFISFCLVCFIFIFSSWMVCWRFWIVCFVVIFLGNFCLFNELWKLGVFFCRYIFIFGFNIVFMKKF